MTSPVLQDTSSSLRRALSLLDAFTAQHQELSIRQLSARSGVSRSTTHRLAQELLAWGALERGSDGLRLGPKLFELGMLTPSAATLREMAAAHLHALHEVTRLTANLAIRDGDEIVYLDKLSKRGLNVPHTRTGGRGTLHATALGKAMLAFGASPEDADLATLLTPVTPRTITSVAGMRRELARVRSERVAFDVEESQLGIFCVAAPVLDVRGMAIAAISVTGATALSQARGFASAVLQAAVAVGRDRSGLAAA
ncbi:MAG: IclR family transcriptional regulator [Pseudoclavibacter sp.]